MTLKDLLEVASKGDNYELLEKTAEAIMEIDKIDRSFTADVYNEFGLIAEVTTEKLAASPFVSAAKGVGTVMGAALLASLGGSIATDLYDAARRGLTKADNFKRILSANPELRQVEDKGKLRASFDALHRYSPEFTADPLMGGAILRNMIESLPGSEPRIIMDLINGRKNLIEARNKSFALPLKGESLLKKKKDE